MRSSICLVLALTTALTMTASSPAASAEDCPSVTPQRWTRGDCKIADLRASLFKTMDESARALISDDCSSVSPEKWLVGTWKIGQTMLIIVKNGDGFDWKMDRKVGQVSQTWGEKEAAQGTGRVASITGCKAELKGAYTAYSGRGAMGRNPIGWQMDYSLDLVALDHLAGTGIGYGQKPYRILFGREK